MISVRVRRFLRDLLGRRTGAAPAAPRATMPAGMVGRAEAAVDRVVKARCRTAGVFSLGATAVDPACFAIWITTATDRERDRLRADTALAAACRAALLGAGSPAAAVPRVGFAFESQETVNRDYGGNWWYAVK